MPTALATFVNIIEDLIPVGRHNRPRTPIQVQAVTIHNTANASPGADAAAHARWVSRTGHTIGKDGNPRWVSWHFTVDDRAVIQHLPLHEMGWHAGTRGNRQSLGIEICMNRGIDQTAANLRAATLAAALLNDLGLTAAQLRTHHSWTGKACPQKLLDGGLEGTTWAAFVDLVASLVRSLAGRSEPAVLAPAVTRAVERAGVRALERPGTSPTTTAGADVAAPRGAGKRKSRSAQASDAADAYEHDHDEVTIAKSMLSAKSGATRTRARSAAKKKPSPAKSRAPRAVKAKLPAAKRGPTAGH